MIIKEVMAGKEGTPTGEREEETHETPAVVASREELRGRRRPIARARVWQQRPCQSERASQIVAHEEPRKGQPPPSASPAVFFERKKKKTPAHGLA